MAIKKNFYLFSHSMCSLEFVNLWNPTDDLPLVNKENEIFRENKINNNNKTEKIPSRLLDEISFYWQHGHKKLYVHCLSIIIDPFYVITISTVIMLQMNKKMKRNEKKKKNITCLHHEQLKESESQLWSASKNNIRVFFS